MSAVDEPRWARWMQGMQGVHAGFCAPARCGRRWPNAQPAKMPRWTEPVPMGPCGTRTWRGGGAALGKARQAGAEDAAQQQRLAAGGWQVVNVVQQLIKILSVLHLPGQQLPAAGSRGQSGYRRPGGRGEVARLVTSSGRRLPAMWPSGQAACSPRQLRLQSAVHLYNATGSATWNRRQAGRQGRQARALSTHCPRPATTEPRVLPAAALARLLVLSLLGMPHMEVSPPALAPAAAPAPAGRSGGSMSRARCMLSQASPTEKMRWQAASRCTSWRSVPVHVRAWSTCTAVGEAP